jgi:diguanylate cyclase (GGDEF)-like protein/PAS domain S-box-containing protein
MELSKPAGPAEFGLGLEDAVREEQLKLLLNNRADLYAAVLWAAVVVAVDRDVFPNWLLTLWFLLLCGLVLTRSLFAHRFRAIPVHSRKSLRGWSNFAAGTATVHGVLWGLTASAILLSPELGIRVFTMIMLGGLAAGGLMASAAAAAPMLCFALPTIIPAILAMGTRPGGMYLGFAVMQAFYALIVINAAVKFNRGIAETMRLRFAQADLLAKLRTSESAMAEAQQFAKVGSWDVDLNTGTGTFSAEAYGIFGVDPASFQPSFKTALARVHPDDRPVLTRYLAEFSDLAVLPGIDLRLVMDDGAIKYVREYRRKIYGADGKALRMVGSIQDISERRHAEQKLNFANLVLNTQMEASPDGILVIDASWHLIGFNQRFSEMWGIPPADLVNADDNATRVKMAAKVKAASDYAARVKFLSENLDEVGDDEIEMADGRLLERFSRSLKGVGGEYLGRVWFYGDITRRRAAEKELLVANILLKTQMEASPDGLLVVSPDHRVISFNRRLAEMWDIPVAELEGNEAKGGFSRMMSSVIDSGAFMARIAHLMAHPNEVGQDEIETRDGRIFDRHSVALHTDAGEYLGRTWVYSDITERRTAERKLLYTNILLTTKMEASPDGIMVVDPRRRATMFNRRFSEIWRLPQAMLVAGNDDAIRLRMRSQVKDLDVYLARVQYLNAHQDETGKDEIETLDGRIIKRHSTTLRTPAGEHLGAVMFFSDITERKQAAATLNYRDRLLHAVTAATGVAVRAASLAAGVPVALRKIGESMGVQRIMVFQDMPDDNPPLALRFGWEAPDIPVLEELIAASTPPFDQARVAAWREPLRAGVPVFADAATATGDVLAMLNSFCIKSVILMPVYVGAQVWGFIGVDDCKAARQWTASEIETIGILADIAGALIVRERARVALATSEELFRLLAATAKDAVILAGPNGEVLQWNPAAERIFGYTAAEATGKPAVQLIVRPADRQRVSRGIAGAGADLSMTIELVLMRKDGSEVATEMSVSAMPIAGKQGVLAILRDITERKSAEAKLQFANIMLKTQMEASPDGIVAIDAEGMIVSFNQRYAEMWNLPAALLKAGVIAPVRAAAAALMKDPEAFLARVDYLLASPSDGSDDELEMADGRLLELHTRALQSAGDENLGRAWFFRDITARRYAEALALRLARYDVLTGLANRAVFIEAVQQAIAQTRRGGEGFAILYLDLDRFKDVNDTLGHPAGDELLKEVATRLRANTRETDTVGRFGGDEFAVVATDIKGPAEAALLAEKLVAAIAVPWVINGNHIRAEASIGLDLFSPKAEDPETLLSHADIALYRAKSEGRGTYRFFTASMDRDAHARVRLGGELREALEAGQLFVLYQPQVAAATGRIIGLEALVRWRHPTRGVLVPGHFIPVAEATGMIGALGHFVLWEACRQARAWIDAGLPPTRVSVNVSALQFKTALALEADIGAALHATGLPPHLLELELTETVLMDASRDHNDTLRRLRERGVKFSIDDFGTGYSSLDYLRRYPVDYIKIPQSFIKHIETEPGDASVVRAIIGLARVLRIKVIAEGIVTRSQLELLQSWGCSEMQGFYFAHPLPADDITGLLQSGGTIAPTTLAREPQAQP